MTQELQKRCYCPIRVAALKFEAIPCRRNMWDIEEAELAFKQLPYYRSIVKSFIKKQIQQLLEEMCREAGEESVIMTVNLQTGTMSHLGSDVGKAFLDDRKDLKTQFLSYCISNINQRASSTLPSNPTNDPQNHSNGKENLLNKSSTVAAVTSRDIQQQQHQLNDNDNFCKEKSVTGVIANNVINQEDGLIVKEKNHDEIVIEIVHSGPEISENTEQDCSTDENTSGSNHEIQEQPTDNVITTNQYNSCLEPQNEKEHFLRSAEKKSVEKKVSKMSNIGCNVDQRKTQSFITDIFNQSEQNTFLEIPVKLEERILEENRNSAEELSFLVKETPDGHIRIEPLEDIEMSAEQQTSNSDPEIAPDDLDFSSSDEYMEISEGGVRHRNKFTVSEKREITEHVMKNPNMSQRGVARYFTKKWGKRLPPSTLRGFLKNKEKWTSGSEYFKVRARTAKHVSLDETLYRWYSDLSSRNVVVSGDMLVKKAKKLGCEMGIQDLSYSNGWLARFKKRHGITVCKPKCKKDPQVQLD